MTTHSQTLQEHQDKMLLRMARIGDIDDKLIYIIRLSEPNNVPHFHICDRATYGNKFHVCIKNKESEYHNYTGDGDVLSADIKRRLVEFLCSSDKWGMNHWDIVLQEWNRNNPDIEIDPKTPMPDYNKL